MEKDIERARLDPSSARPLKLKTIRQLFTERVLLFAALISLLVLLWGFVVITATHHIKISNTNAALILWAVPHTVSVLVSPFSTGFNLFISFLYARSLRLAAQKRLTEQPSDLHALVGWNALMSKSLMGLPFGAGSRWSKLALLSFILVWSVATGFTAFITPRELFQTRSLEEFGELDMSNSAFLNNVYTPMSNTLPCRYGHYSFFSCSRSRSRQPLLLLNAGESAALVDLNYSVITNFATASFNGTSGGIMPTGAYFFSIWFADNFSHPYYNFEESHRTASNLDYTVSYVQQGLTANVACTLDGSSPLAFTVDPAFAQVSNVSEFNSTLSLIKPTVTCDNVGTTSLPQQIVGADFLLAASCSFPNQTQHIYLRGVGAYETDPDDGDAVIANMTCILDPIFTKNNVSYNSVFNTLTVVPTGSGESALSNSNTTLIRDITATLTQNILEGQSGDGSTFADLVQGMALANSGLGSKPLPNAIVQSMFRGMFEISGLAINGYWSSRLFTNASIDDLKRSPYVRQVSGTVAFSLYGWDGGVKSTVGLIPFTIVTGIALLLLFKTRDSSELRFDPSNPIHLVAASSAGEFSPCNIETDDDEKLKTRRIEYAHVNGKWALTDRIVQHNGVPAASLPQHT